ncbi:hypothetical protein Q8F55_005449 [Vanrija albida]|uniref:Uncharacterized protein n=1 Tax=Vanrija albida TaxID=181172 RepID=A0ABR3Q1V6_9TREE
MVGTTTNDAMVSANPAPKASDSIPLETLELTLKAIPLDPTGADSFVVPVGDDHNMTTTYPYHNSFADLTNIDNEVVKLIAEHTYHVSTTDVDIFHFVMVKILIALNTSLVKWASFNFHFNVNTEVIKAVFFLLNTINNPFLRRLTLENIESATDGLPNCVFKFLGSPRSKGLQVFQIILDNRSSIHNGVGGPAPPPNGKDTCLDRAKAYGRAPIELENNKNLEDFFVTAHAGAAIFCTSPCTCGVHPRVVMGDRVVGVSWRLLSTNEARNSKIVGQGARALTAAHVLRGGRDPNSPKPRVHYSDLPDEVRANIIRFAAADGKTGSVPVISHTQCMRMLEYAHTAGTLLERARFCAAEGLRDSRTDAFTGFMTSLQHRIGNWFETHK